MSVFRTKYGVQHASMRNRLKITASLFVRYETGSKTVTRPIQCHRPTFGLHAMCCVLLYSNALANEYNIHLFSLENIQDKMTIAIAGTRKSFRPIFRYILLNTLWNWWPTIKRFNLRWKDARLWQREDRKRTTQQTGQNRISYTGDPDDGTCQGWRRRRIKKVLTAYYKNQGNEGKSIARC